MSESTTRRLHAIVKGQVQGVGYRQYAVRQARALGLTGWVRNLHDRSVEVVAEGPEDRLETFTASLREGPSSAVVWSVDVRYEQVTGHDTAFRVEY